MSRTTRSAIAFALVLCIFIRHEGIFWIAKASGLTPQWTSYMLGGMLEVVLCAIVLTFAISTTGSIWRDLMLTGSIIGILEGAQIPTCRILVFDISKVPRGTNICDFLLGFPVSHAVFAVYFLFTCWIIGRWWACRATR